MENRTINILLVSALGPLSLLAIIIDIIMELYTYIIHSNQHLISCFCVQMGKCLQCMLVFKNLNQVFVTSGV